jgi:uncharacterized protein (TIGR03437 family)
VLKRSGILLKAILLPVAAGIMFGQTAAPRANPGSLGAIFAGQFAAQLAAADTVTVSISAGGIVPASSSVAGPIQAGSWINIYGSNLAAGVANWTGDFPLNLNGTSVTVNNKPAYLSYVSPTQVNVQAPDDTAIGSVVVTVTNSAANSTGTSTATLAPAAPSFLLLDGKHVAGIIPRTDGSGAYANGAYDIIGPTGSSLGYPTKAAKAGEIVELFGVGFGATNPPVPAGAPFAGAAPAANPIQVLLGAVSVTPGFSGITGPGLFQFNVTIPAGLGTGDLPLAGTVTGVQTPPGPVISVQ